MAGILGELFLQYVNLGKSGLKVSRIGLGCMSFGLERDNWMLGQAEGLPILERAVELGITLIDTANTYGDGASEMFLGRFLWERIPRENVVLASKVFYPMRSDPNGRGLSRKAIFSEIDASLRRLRTDYLDLYQVHRWDADTPIEETLEALNDLVRQGKVRYIGASMMCAWQLSKALYTSDRHGWTALASMQPRYNLISREIEREILPLCVDRGLGVLPYSPLARGRLARRWADRKATTRSQSDQLGDKLYDPTSEADAVVAERLAQVAGERGLPISQIALAWLLHNPAVTAPLVGATNGEQLDDAAAAVAVSLSEEEMRLLEGAYVPHAWVI
jgi:1-deoxyxylulose-5-phosphate synthase